MRIGRGYDFTLSCFICKDSRVQDPAYNELGQKGTQPRAKKAKKPAEGEDEVGISVVSQIGYHANEFRMLKGKHQLQPPRSAVAARKLKTATRRMRSQPQNALRKRRRRKLTLSLHPRKSLCLRRSVASVLRRKRNLMRMSRPIRRMR